MRTAKLLAQWQAVGFCHGVMNTDNMSILGLTIDYGPFQFLDGFDPGHICNHSDSQGRYAFGKQPHVAHWNLFCLGQALLPLIEEQELALAALASYATAFQQAYATRMCAKLGLPDVQEQDAALIEATLNLLAQERTDYTLFWHRLTQHVAGAPVSLVRDMFIDTSRFDTWMSHYASRLAQVDRTQAAHLMRSNNPRFVLRNYLGEQVIEQVRHRDFSGLQALQSVLESPYDEHPEYAKFADFPPDWASSITISCSS